jgi:hypothetical protein
MSESVNPFYEAAVNHMHNQLNWLEEAVGRPLTLGEKENIYEFFQGLHPRTKEEFQDIFGPVF